MTIPGANTVEHFYPRSLGALESIVADTAGFFARHGIDPGLRTAVDLAIEELFVNMVKYNRGTTHDIRIGMRAQGGGIEVELTDFDVERFDPTRAAPPDLDAPLDQREPRGLGIYLVLQVVDSIRYEFRDRQSRITFSKGVG
jgi:anti-sigma regulatory factor (Ser/Thr protein kinase)